MAENNMKLVIDKLENERQLSMQEAYFIANKYKGTILSLRQIEKLENLDTYLIELDKAIKILEEIYGRKQ